MKGLSITGLVLGVTGPAILLAPFAGALLGGDDYWSVGWLFLLVTIPLGLAVSIAGDVLVIIAASLAIKRRFRPRSVAIVGISLTGAGLLLQLAGAVGFFGPGSGWELWVLAVGIVIGLTGVIMSAVVGLRPVLALRR